jgi:hypothetical protein
VAGDVTRVALGVTLVVVAAGCVSFDLDSRRFRCDGDPAICGEGLVCGSDGYCAPMETPGIPCGADACDEATEECCVDGDAQTCVAADTCTSTTFGCDGPEDCRIEGEICCGAGDGAHCEVALECGQAVCHLDADCASANEKCCTLAGDAVKRCFPVMCPIGG